MKNISYQIEILGSLWMSKSKAATEIRIKVGTKPFEVNIDLNNELESLKIYLVTKTGDFSNVIDYKIVKRYQVDDIWQSDNEPTLRTEYVTIKEWEHEQNEIDYYSCLE